MNNSDTTLSPPSSAPNCTAKHSLAQRMLLGLIGGYRRVFSGRTSPCRFIPSCSEYALEAVETHGAGRGSYLAARRILRCNPFGPHGVDLVPEPRKKRDRS
jgi:putative membrane protein insertion efficiency factor